LQSCTGLGASPTSDRVGQRARVDSLTGLRFFAALYVVLFHQETTFATTHHASKPLVTFLGHGYLAVSLFFVLSGFVLTYNYADRWHETRFRKFLLARFARIYPVYILALLLQLPFYWHAATVLTTLAVVFMVQSWTVMPSQLPSAWNFPAWTLSIEWFFYLCFPLLLHTVRKVQNKTAAIWITALLSVAVGGVQAAIGGRHSWLAAHIPLPLLRLPEFYVGMLLARYQPKRSFSGRLPLFISVTAAVLLLVLNTHRFVTLIIIPFAAIIWLLANEYSLLGRLLESKLLVLLGGASYAIYLLQVPMRNWLVTGTVSRTGELASAHFYIPLLILVGICIFLGFEQPARRLIREKAFQPKRHASRETSSQSQEVEASV
jgi:peptidoglycan/LPS O-acetylase OafA/YrhL